VIDLGRGPNPFLEDRMMLSPQLPHARFRQIGAALVWLAPWLLCLSSAEGGKVETWRIDSASAFSKGKREHVVVSDTGRVRLGQTLDPTETIDALRIWDLARGPDGSIYAATGDAGKVFRRQGDKPWTVVYDGPDTQALSLVVGADGHVFVGTGPSGQVVDVTDPAHTASRPDPAVQYIWDLAADRDGNLYAATGPTGQLWKRSRQGDWKLLYDSKHPHLLCVVVAPDGSVYTGSDGEGLIYRVTPDGATTVVYDASQSEVRTLLVAPDGAIYAGTAAEAGGGGGPPQGRGTLAFSTGDAPPPAPGSPRNASGPAQLTPRGDTPKSSTPPGGSAAPKPVVPGDNAVYRIGSDGVPREVFRARALIYALAWQGERLLVGTGPEGQLYEVRDQGRESAPIARLDHGQILALLVEPSGEVLLGTGEPGSVARLSARYAPEGTLTSEAHDAKYFSRFGAVVWRAQVPKGAALSVQVRTGNVGEPDSTWSAWSAPQSNAESARASVAPGRFVQLRTTLSTTDSSVTPELDSVALRFQTVNLPPEIGRIDVPDLAEGDGATRQTRLTLRWDVTDPNGDDLSYTLHIRKEGWPDWVRLGNEPLTEKTYNWDTTAVPAGVYRLRVTATDRPSNEQAEALTRDRTTEPFIVDHQSPTVNVAPLPDRTVKVTLRDSFTRLVKAAYSLDGGDWVAIFPDDGLFDTTNERLTISLTDLKSGTHIVTVRATDAAGNVGAGDAVFTIP
jgi:hypothetical protein